MLLSCDDNKNGSDDGGGGGDDGVDFIEPVSASNDATLKLLIRDVIVFICGGESISVTDGLDIVTTRMGVTVIID